MGVFPSPFLTRMEPTVKAYLNEVQGLRIARANSDTNVAQETRSEDDPVLPISEKANSNQTTLNRVSWRAQ